jgi:hypothetical protein
LPETYTQDPNQISRLDIVTPKVPKVNYNYNSPPTGLDSEEESEEQVSHSKILFSSSLMTLTKMMVTDQTL